MVLKSGPLDQNDTDWLIKKCLEYRRAAINMAIEDARRSERVNQVKKEAEELVSKALDNADLDAVAELLFNTGKNKTLLKQFVKVAAWARAALVKYQMPDASGTVIDAMEAVTCAIKEGIDD